MRGHIRKYQGKKGTTWTAYFYLGYDTNGKKKYSTKRGFRTRKEAETYLANLTKELHSGEYREPSEKTVGEFLSQWLDYKRDFVRHRSIEIYGQAIRIRIEPFIGKVKLKDLKPAHLRDLYTTLQRKQGLSARTVTQVHNILHDAFDRALKWELVTRNVTDAVDTPKPIRKSFNVWTLEEVKRFLSNEEVKTSRFYAAYLLALTTGMRHGEILGLRWQDIDLENNRIAIRNNLSWVGKEYVLGPPKSDAGKRDIMIPDSVVAALKAHKARQNEDRLKMHNTYVHRDLVTCRVNGDFIPESTLRGDFLRLIQAANVPRIRFHDMRHTHASILLELGEEVRVIQGQLGHANISITADIYTHLSDTVKARPAQLISAALFGK